MFCTRFSGNWCTWVPPSCLGSQPCSASMGMNHDHSHHMPKRFEPLGGDLSGLWGHPSSSIDWCERNYVVTYYVAEFFNTISNIGLIVAGAYAMYTAHKYGFELRFYALGAGVVVVGLGSAAFHCTLQYWGQLWDEVPMVWTMLIWFYVFLQMTKPGSVLLALALFVYGVMWSFIHASGAYTIEFQVHFGLMIFVGVYFLRNAVLRHLKVPFLPKLTDLLQPSDLLEVPKEAELKMRRMAHWYLIYILAAFSLWLLDQFLCPHLNALPMDIPNPQFHALWHLLTGSIPLFVLCIRHAMPVLTSGMPLPGANCHFGLHFVMALRQSIRDRAPPATEWRLRGLFARCAKTKRGTRETKRRTSSPSPKGELGVSGGRQRGSGKSKSRSPRRRKSSVSAK